MFAVVDTYKHGTGIMLMLPYVLDFEFLEAVTEIEIELHVIVI